MGGPLRGLVLQVQLVRLPSHEQGDEVVLHSETFRNLYLGYPNFLARMSVLTRTYMAPYVIRFTKVAGDGTGIGDVVVCCRYKRRAASTPPGVTDPWASSTV